MKSERRQLFVRLLSDDASYAQINECFGTIFAAKFTPEVANNIALL